VVESAGGVGGARGGGGGGGKGTSSSMPGLYGAQVNRSIELFLLH